MNPAAVQSDSRPVRQYRHSPQVSISSAITRSPTCQPSTPSPSAAIRPTTSTPGMNGGSTGKRETPSRMSTSRWLSALAVMSTSTWPVPGSGIRELLQPQHVETAELVEHDRFHAPTSRNPLAARGLRLCLTSERLSS